MNKKLMFGLIGALGFFMITTLVLASMLIIKPESATKKADLSPTLAPTTVATRVPTPTVEAKKKVKTLGRKITSFEEAVEGVKELMKPYTVDMVRVDGIEIVQKPNKTQYIFRVNGRLNPRQDDEYTKPVYDYKDVDITLISTGEYEMNVWDNTFLKTMPKYWDDYADINEVKYDDILQLARTRVTESGKTPGDIVTGTFEYCQNIIESCTSNWKFGFVLKGEETNEKKGTVFVEFKDTDFQEINEGTIELSSGEKI